ncbi:MAG: hypothetical protein PUH77_06905 [Bacteroidales bacterium]|nr:hypothetical protein [Bacteroidales bacterium]MDY2860111.1 hypothetical protein [Candidatus Cryptobacteroides sp.]MDY5442368.1 hypothetical protein [Candidatus Cryptobacteroides sp.]
MRVFLSALVGLMLSVSAFAQTASGTVSVVEHPSPATAVKSSLDGPMYEIVAMADSNVYMFRINKETGEVLFLGNEKFVKLSREASEDDTTMAGKVNYQLVMSSSTVYLMNVNTGTLWYLKSQGLTHANDSFVLVKEK